jgi:hypothetical protein
LRLSLDELPEQSLICQRGAYLASNPSVEIEMEFTKSLRAGFFGGQGFILQKLSGVGDVLVKGGGTIVIQNLSPGEVIRVTSGSIVAFERTVQYDVQMIPGIRNAMFGGEGLFITSLTGPGRVWLQGMPADRMIAEIARRVPAGGIGMGIPMGLGGGGGGGGADAGEGADAAAAEGGGSAEDAVAAGDASVEAERASTVATSGGAVDAESPSALFGDAAPDGEAVTAASDAKDPEDSFSTTTESTIAEDDDFSSTTDFEEPSFNEEEFSSSSTSGDGGLFDDTTTTEGLGGDAVSEEGSSGIFRTLWDFFMHDDD